MALKTCRACEQEKEISKFDKNPTGIHGVRGTCRECRGSNKERTKRHNIKAKYGIVLKDFMTMYENQGGCCAICNKEMELYATRDKVADVANIDHCHVTNKVRALLCNHCNTGLGKFMESTDLLLKAVNYLNNYHQWILMTDKELKMSLTKEKVVDQITVTENGTVLYREATRIMEDGNQISQTYHRSSLAPEADLTGVPANVVAICNVVWTPEVIDAYKAQQVKNTLPVQPPQE